MSRITILLLLTIFLSSCAIVVNYTENKPAKCTKHNIVLKKKIVKRVFGRPITKHYLDLDKYPFTKHSPRGKIMMTWPNQRYAKICVCDSCSLMFQQEIKLN